MVRNEDELENATGIRNFGGIYEYPYTSKLDLFLHDERIYRLRRRKGKQSDQITDDLLAKMEYLNSTQVTFLTLGKTTDKILEITSKQKKAIRVKDKTVLNLHFANVLEDSTDSMFSDMKNVFLVLIGNTTKWEDVQRLLLKFKEYNIHIIGSEYIEV